MWRAGVVWRAGAMWGAGVCRVRLRVKRGAHGGQRRLGRALARRQPEVPVEDLGAAAMPLIGPREHERADAAGASARFELPVQRPGLLLLAVAATVEAELGHQQRAIVGQVLQPREVALEQLAPLQVDVERQEVKARQPQVLGGWEVDVGDQRAGVLIAGGATEALEKALYTSAPVPAHDRRGDLVADGVAEHGRVAGARADRRTHRLLDSIGGPGVEKRDVLFPGDADHHQQAVLLRKVEQPRRRRRVYAHGVDPGARHLLEVSRGCVGLESAAGLRAERPVGDALDDQLLLAEIQRLAANRRARRGGCRDGRGDRDVLAVGGGVWVGSRCHDIGRAVTA